MADNQQLAAALSGTIKPTPRNPVLGGVADLLGMAYKLPEMPRMGVPGMDFLAANRNKVLDLLGIGDVQKTADTLSYGFPIGTGKGMTYKLKPETIGAAMALAPMVAPAARMVGKGAVETGRFVAPKAGQLAEEYMQGMGMMPGIVQKTPNIKDVSYRGQGHLAPNADTYGATLDDLTKIMPDDVYSAQGKQLYGIGDVQKTADALSYGNAIGTGKGMTYRPKDETINAALAVAPFAGKAIRATEGLPVGASTKLVESNPLMSIPNGLTRAEQANLIQSHAENFAAKAKELGLSASVEHSGSKAGPSSYVSISDPITGKKFESPFRFSGHGKGPTQNEFVYNVGDDFSKELNLLENMASSIPRAERDAIQSARQAKMFEELALAKKERLFSQGRPAVQQAMQEANLQQAPYTKAFSNSGNYLGGLLAP
jgi:hypothetical protein